MNWKVKAFMQSAVSRLPSEASFNLYYGIQRTCGALRRVDPMVGLEDGLRLVDGIEAAGATIAGRTVLEVGTGRRINVPIALWLCGAAQTITVDVNRYLKESLIEADLAFMRANQAEVRALFGARSETEAFHRRLTLLARNGPNTQRFMRSARIHYLAPQDARLVPMADQSVDFHVSNNTLEHIPPADLRDIMGEGRRVVREDGLLVHRVDFSDHFSEVDDAISTINFLRYSEDEWRRYADNRYNYHNRLRIDELEELIADAGLTVVRQQPRIDEAALRLLENGFSVDPRFAEKPSEINATESAVMILARGRQARPAAT